MIRADSQALAGKRGAGHRRHGRRGRRYRVAAGRRGSEGNNGGAQGGGLRRLLSGARRERARIALGRAPDIRLMHLSGSGLRHPGGEPDSIATR